MATRRRKSDAARKANQTIRSRTLLMLLVFGVVTFGMLFWKLYQLQIVRHDDLQQKGVSQWTRSSVVNAFRGTIYDRNSNVLAISATAETVCISPKDIQEFMDSQDEKIRNGKLDPNDKITKEYIAAGLARILELDADAILQKMEKTNWEYVELKKKTERTVSDEVRRFMNGTIDEDGNEIMEVNAKGEIVPVTKPTKLRGVFLVNDSKRYYPYSNLAAQVIGFVNANGGAYGLESSFESTLEGTAGYTITAKNNQGDDLLYQYEQYYDAENGGDLVLTLDSNIQYYLEEGLESMVDKFNAANGAAGIVMNAKTGAILGMASYPSYDLNNYSMVFSDELAATLEGLEPGTEKYQSALSAAQLKQWRNKCINDTYEPGSTFKPITLAAALEEGVINKSSTFNCTGSVRVDEWTMHCSKKAGHGLQTLEVAVGNSCNPAFIEIGMRTGSETYYQYLQAFGLMETTNIELNGEAYSLFIDEKTFNNDNSVSLASYSFGQTFNVTPLQLIRAQAATINGGYLYEPYLVEQVLDGSGNVIYQHEVNALRQVISEETSATVRECLEYVVAEGTGKNGQVAGYRIGGKTGTADKTGSKTEENPKGDIVVSFMCFAPADDPEIIMLLTLDTPDRNTGTYPSGGNMVAPTASAVMSEILPYLGYAPDYSAEEMAAADTTVPNCVGLSKKEAVAKLEKSGFAYKLVGDGDKVTDQTPVGNAIVPNNATVILYMGAEKSQELCKVPIVVGMTAAKANQALTNAGLIMRVTGVTDAGSGNVYAISQDVDAGEMVAAGTVVTVRFSDSSVLD